MAPHRREVLFEMTRVGNYVRVCAIDPVTRTEVTMVGDPAQGDETLKRLAMRKLFYVLEKKRAEREAGEKGWKA
jgi:hypothetical protein